MMLSSVAQLLNLKLHRRVRLVRPCTSEASTADPPPLKRCRSSLFASYERHSAKASAVANQQQMNLRSVVMEYLEYVTTARTRDSDLGLKWHTVTRSKCCIHC